VKRVPFKVPYYFTHKVTQTRQNNIISQNLKYRKIVYAWIETSISERVAPIRHSLSITMILVVASCTIKSSGITSGLGKISCSRTEWPNQDSTKFCKSFSANGELVDMIYFYSPNTFNRHLRDNESSDSHSSLIAAHYIFHELHINRHPKPGRLNHKVNSALARAQTHNRHR
jgi:hypothetical protein